MRARRAAGSLAATTLVVLSLASCGSDDDAQAVAALKSQIVANNAMAGSTEISDKQATCIAKGAVDAITVDRLQDYKILDDDLDVGRRLSEVPLSAKDAKALADVYLDCSDAEKIVEDRLVARLTAAKSARRTAVEKCVRDTVTADAVRDILAQSFEKARATAYADLGKRLADCKG
jgi:hypothetical protein